MRTSISKHASGEKLDICKKKNTYIYVERKSKRRPANNKIEANKIAINKPRKHMF